MGVSQNYKVQHPYPCRCESCRLDRAITIRELRTDGHSIPDIARTVNVSFATVHRALRDVPQPTVVTSLNGKQFKRKER